MALANATLTLLFLIIYCRGKALEFKTRDRWFTSRHRFVFCTQNTTGQSRVRGKALAFNTIGRGIAPRQRFLIFTRGHRRRVSIYKSDSAERRQETAGRSGVGVLLPLSDVGVL